MGKKTEESGRRESSDEPGVVASMGVSSSISAESSSSSSSSCVHELRIAMSMSVTVHKQIREQQTISMQSLEGKEATDG
jgi:hypothetical protein